MKRAEACQGGRLRQVLWENIYTFEYRSRGAIPESVPVKRLPTTAVLLPPSVMLAADTCRLAPPCTTPAPPPPLSAADDPKAEALEGLGGEEPRINGFRFLSVEEAMAAEAGTGVALAAFLLAGAADRPPVEAAAARAAALEEAALIRAAAAADADSLVRGGLTDSRWARDFPGRPFMPGPLVRIPPEVDKPELPRDRTLGEVVPPGLLFGQPPGTHECQPSIGFGGECTQQYRRDGQCNTTVSAERYVTYCCLVFGA